MGRERIEEAGIGGKKGEDYLTEAAVSLHTSATEMEWVDDGVAACII